MIKLTLKILAAAIVMGVAVPAWFVYMEELPFDYQMILFGVLFGGTIAILNWLASRERGSDDDIRTS